MSKSVHQLVLLANGELRIPDGTGPEGTTQVAHGHRTPDEQISIVMPANKNWILIELHVESEEVAPPSIASKIPS